jgi:hypothetical protein
MLSLPGPAKTRVKLRNPFWDCLSARKRGPSQCAYPNSCPNWWFPGPDLPESRGSLLHN